jgi:chorismate mutase
MKKAAGNTTLFAPSRRPDGPFVTVTLLIWDDVDANFPAASVRRRHAIRSCRPIRVTRTSFPMSRTAVHQTVGGSVKRIARTPTPRAEPARR